jgi:diadenosine tetraphosphate (Ap4A) HIT family hydrolase
MEIYDSNCKTCDSIIGKERISPGPTIFEGSYWLVEHAYPTAVKGWLVLLTRRHVTALHELTTQEFMEFSGILQRTSELLYKVLKCEKEYNAFFAEGTGFNHLHYHLVAKTPNWPEEYKGPKMFGLLKTTPLPIEEIIQFSNYLKDRYQP